MDWFEDGDRIVTGGEDQMIKVWEVETGDIIINYTAHKGMVRSVSLSPDGKKIVSGADDHTSRIWNLNIPPPAPDLIISPVALPRSHTAVLKASVEYPDPVDTLAPEFQFKEHSSSVWKDQYFSSPTFNNEEWDVNFTPDINASLGYYDFRVRIENEQHQSSSWTTKTSPIEVVNNQPSAVIWSAPSKVFRGKTGTLGVAVSDVETPANDILIRAEYSPVSVEDWSTDIFGSSRFNGSSGMWDCDFVFPITSTPGAYRFRARCTDKSLGISDWDFLPNPISVVNNLPSVMDFEIIPSTVIRGGSATIWLDVEDVEEGKIVEELEVEIKGRSGDWALVDFSLNALGSNYTARYNTYADSEIGGYDFRIRMMDSEGVFSDWIEYDLYMNVINNPPMPREGRIKPFQLFGDKAELFDLSGLASDIEDPSSRLIWEVNHSPSMLFSAQMINDTWLEIVPVQEMGLGEGTITFKVTDGDGDHSYKEITVEILDPFSRPHMEVNIISPVDGMIVGESSVMLSWDMTDTTAMVKYNVYWGESRDDLTLLHRGLSASELEIHDLSNGTTYWWKIEVNVFDIPYTYESELGNFTVRTGFLPIHEIDLTFDRESIDIKRGVNASVELTITNPGNVPEVVYLDIIGSLDDYVSIPKIVRVDPGEDQIVTLNIRNHDSLKDDRYLLTAMASYGDEETSERLEVRLGENEKSPATYPPLVRYSVWIGIILFLGTEFIYGVFWFIQRRKTKKLDDIMPVPVYVSPYETPDSYSLAPTAYQPEASSSYSDNSSPYQPETDVGIPALPPHPSSDAIRQLPPVPAREEQLMLAPPGVQAAAQPTERVPEENRQLALQTPFQAPMEPEEGGYGTPHAYPTEGLPAGAPLLEPVPDHPSEPLLADGPAVGTIGEDVPLATIPSVITRVDDTPSLGEELADLRALIGTIIRKDKPLESLSSLGEMLEKNSKDGREGENEARRVKADERLAFFDNLTRNDINADLTDSEDVDHYGGYMGTVHDDEAPVLSEGPANAPKMTEIIMQCHACNNKYKAEIEELPSMVICPHCEAEGMINSI